MRRIFALVLALASIPALAADKVPLAKQLAANPVALVKGDRCHISGAVWLYGPRAHAEVEVLDGTHVWRTRTNAQGFYSISIPYPGHDVALIERPVQMRIHTRDKTPVHVGKPALLCSQRLTNQLLTQRKAKP